MGRRIFITGASGFLGRALAAHFGARGETVAGVDLIANPERDVVAGDVAEAAPGRLRRARTSSSTRLRSSPTPSATRSSGG